MTIRRIEDYSHIFENETIAKLLMLCMINPTYGKVQNIAQSVYAKNQGRFYVCEKDGEIIGIAGGSQINNDQFILRHMAVAPEQKRTGIGKKLLSALIADGHYDSVALECDYKSVKFFKNFGFKCVSDIDPILEMKRYNCLLDVKKWRASNQ